MKRLERFLEKTINLSKSDKYADYAILIDKQTEFTSLNEE